jgi:uncharacterized protein (TIGR02001 family)
MKKIIYTILALLMTTLSVKAEETEKESKVDFSLGADFVSSYVWRGAYQTSAAIQPSMGVSAYGFSLSAWGSVPFQGVDKEVDFTAAYEIDGLKVAITDYWWAGEGAYKYFTYDSHATEHHFEGTLEYTLPFKKFPLSLGWNTMFAGEDYTKANGDRAYSTYISASYPFKVKDVDLGLSIGITPWEGMYAEDFSVINIGLKAEKEIRITEKFALPVFGEVMVNPRSEDIFFVFGFSL